MSIRPIDFQVGVTRSTETSRVNSNENARPDLQQQFFSKEFERKTELESKQVIQSNKSNFGKVNEEGKGKNQYKRNNKDDEKNEKEKNDTTKTQKSSTSMYDISI